jgi:hypothetical protein
MSESSGGANGPQRPSQSRLAASANTPMAKTVALVVLALIIGIVMINIVGDGGSTAKTAATTTTPPTTSAATNTTQTTTATKHNSTTTTVKKSNTTVPAAQLSLIVVNSGAPAGSGGNVSTALKGRGYTNQTPTVKVTWSQSGLTVHCKPGLETERTALVNALTGIPNYTAKTAAFKTEPGVPSTVQCYVAIGAA